MTEEKIFQYFKKNYFFLHSGLLMVSFFSKINSLHVQFLFFSLKKLTLLRNMIVYQAIKTYFRYIATQISFFIFFFWRYLKGFLFAVLTLKIGQSMNLFSVFYRIFSSFSSQPLWDSLVFSHKLVLEPFCKLGG